MMRLLPLLVIGSLVAGCAEEAPPAVEPVQETPEVRNFTANMTAPDVAGDGTGGFRLEAEGTAGSWIVAYHPFPTQEAGAGFGYRIDLSTAGPHDTLWIPPSVTIMPDNETFALEEQGPFTPFAEHFVLRGDGLQTRQSGGIGIGHYLPLHGIFLALGSTADWRIELEVVWDDEGSITAPAFLTAGDGFTVRDGSQGLVPVAGGPADAVAFEWEVAAGWNHVELLDHRIQPTGVRQHQVGFPSGYDVAGTGLGYGYNGPLGGSASSGGWLDYAGAFADSAGTVSGEVTYAGASAFFQPVVAHLPLVERPDNMTGNGYWGSTWPLHDPPMPPPQWQMPYEEAVKAGAPARP